LQALNQEGKHAARVAMFELLNNGMGYWEKNPEEARLLIEEWIEQEDTWAITTKLDGLYKGLYGYTASKTQTKEFIEQLALRKNRIGLYLQALGMLYGKLGFEQDKEQAHDSIRLYMLGF